MQPLRIRVYLEDTDAGGIVYHASYLRFFERMRTEFLRHVGLEQSRTFELDVSFVVHTMTLEFQRPAMLDAELEVTCDILEARGARLLFHQVVRDVRDQTVHCTARVSVACIALSTKRPRRLPAEVTSKVGALLAAVDGQ
jgi:acyl-CoA thioester hydrolase